jgi:phosphoribosylaminoimidazole-succinocarboxamide synthase
MLVKEAKKLPLECQILNVATKSLTEKFGVSLEKELEHPILEYYTVDILGKHILINDTHAVALNIVKIEEMQYIERISLKANVILKAYFARRDFKLVEFKLAFGRYKNHIIVLNDLSLDSIHIWDLKSDIHYQSEFFAQNRSEIPALVDELRRRILGE